MSNDLYFGTQWVHHLIIFLPLCLYFTSNGDVIDRKNLLKIYLILSAIYELVNIYTEKNSIPDHWIVNMFLVIEFYLLSNYLFKLINWPMYSSWFGWIQAAYTLLCIYQFGNNHDYMQINNNVKACAAILIILLCILYYFNLLKNILVPNLLKDPYFWVVTSIFFFFCSTFIFSIYSREVLFAEKQLARSYYFFLLLFTIAYRLLLSVAIWNIPAKK
jgi:hypothetical protein